MLGYSTDNLYSLGQHHDCIVKAYAVAATEALLLLAEVWFKRLAQGCISLEIVELGQAAQPDRRNYLDARSPVT